MKNKIYPRTGDKEIVYLKDVVTGPNIEIGDHTIYNDFVRDPRDFEKNNVLLSLPRQRRYAEDRQILLHCVRRKVSLHERKPLFTVALHLHISYLL